MDDKKTPTPQVTMKNAVRAKLGVRAEEKVPVEVEREEKGKWKKGQSGNPKGRPKKVLPNGTSFKDLYKDKQFEMMERLYKLASDDKVSANTQLQAIIEWNNRALGKPKQTVEVDSKVEQVTTTYDFSNVPLDELRRMQSLLGNANVIEGELTPPEDGDE